MCVKGLVLLIQKKGKKRMTKKYRRYTQKNRHYLYNKKFSLPAGVVFEQIISGC